MQLTDKELERFWEKVSIGRDDECWLWTASVNNKGYGRLTIRSKNAMAHRISYMIATGLLPDCPILHSCDTPLCVNPAHLRAGTQKENIVECFAKGRGHKNSMIGEAHGGSKLTEEQVLQIRARKGELHREIAVDYGVSREAVTFILSRRTWTHI